MLVSWAYYVKNLYKSQLQSAKLFSKRPGMFNYPRKTSKFTHLKAPMAHKTFSQEQFKTKFYFMSISFGTNPQLLSRETSNFNETLFLLLDLRSREFCGGTSLFFLKKKSFNVSLRDKITFNINQMF